jgi:hypothetical protein
MNEIPELSQPGGDAYPGKMLLSREWAWVIGILAFFVAINLVTATRGPTVWQDEIMFADPAVNAATGHGLTSTAWPYQRADELWAGNAPLHTWLLAAWLKVWGVSITSVRSINYIYAVVSILLLWTAVRRAGIVKSPQLRLLMVMLILCDYGISFSYRSGRYDMLGIMWTSVAIVAMTINRKNVRLAALFCATLMMPITGIQLLPMVAIAVAIMLLFYGKRVLAEAIALSAGLIIGSVAMYLLLQGLGVWEALAKWLGYYTTIPWTNAHEAGGFPVVRPTKIGGLWDAVGGILNVNRRLGAAQDYSLLPLMLAAAVALIARKEKRLAGMCVALFVALPVGLSLAGQFPSYYTWMPTLPAIFAAVAGSEALLREGKKPLAMVLFAGMGLAAAVGLPARLGIAIWEWNARDPGIVDNFVKAHITAGDVVISDSRSFYPLREIGGKAYFNYLSNLTPAEKDAVNVVLGGDDSTISFRKQLGGNWVESERLWMPGTRFIPPYAMKLYRRE